MKRVVLAALVVGLAAAAGGRADEADPPRIPRQNIPERGTVPAGFVLEDEPYLGRVNATRPGERLAGGKILVPTVRGTTYEVPAGDAEQLAFVRRLVERERAEAAGTARAPAVVSYAAGSCPGGQCGAPTAVAGPPVRWQAGPVQVQMQNCPTGGCPRR